MTQIDGIGEVIATSVRDYFDNIHNQKLLEKLWVRMVLLAAAFGILMYFVMKDRKKKNIEVDKSL